MTHTMALVLGLDVGTGGVRALAATSQGAVLAEAQTALSDQRGKSPIHEQDPTDWWSAICTNVRHVIKDLSKVTSLEAIQGVAVTSTSGSLVLTDSAGLPVRPAILYDDARGTSIAEELNRQLPPELAQFNASYSLIKAAWVQRKEPTVWARVRHLLHPADWLAGKLTGQFETSDDSNALKLGHDPDTGCWSGAVSMLGISTELLPKVLQPGAQVGTVCERAGEETGLRPGTPLLAGATDGMTGLIASGAREPGQASTTLGTTIVWKVLSRRKVRPSPGIYCHRHPSGMWAPGAASNTGPGSLRSGEASIAPADLDRVAAKSLPTTHLCYVLPSKGERFPFLNAAAETFFEGTPASSQETYAAQLQSLAFVERWGYERLEECGAAIGGDVFTTGGAAASPILMPLRASVLKREMHRCQYPTSAFGAAVLAACKPLYGGDLKSAIQGMTRVSERFRPDRHTVNRYDEIYAAFRVACRRRGYG
jgi:sugar (pentulose or hexulose) kinase